MSKLHHVKSRCTDKHSYNCVITWQALCSRVPHFTGWPLEHNAAESDLQWRESCCGFQSHAGSLEHNRQSVGSGGTWWVIKENTAPMWSPNGPLQSPNSLTWSSSILAKTRPPPEKIHIPGFPGFQGSWIPGFTRAGHAPTRCCRTVTRWHWSLGAGTICYNEISSSSWRAARVGGERNGELIAATPPPPPLLVLGNPCKQMQPM